MASEIAKQNRAARFNPQEIANASGLGHPPLPAANAAWASQERPFFDTLATMTLVLGAKSGGDLTKAGFTPREQELSNASGDGPARDAAHAPHAGWRFIEEARGMQWSRSRPTTPPSASRSRN